jgi:hypothetical protein
MQFTTCWTANGADREVRRKIKNETNNICELKSDKTISGCILACNRGHKKSMEIKSHIKSTPLRHDATVELIRIHFL